MKKLYLLPLVFLPFLFCNAQTPKLIFGNTANLSVLNYDPLVNVIQYGSGSTSHTFDLNTDGNADISINLERKLTAQYESAFITFQNAAANVALNTADNMTIVAFKQGDSLYADKYSFDFDETAFDGALLYVNSGSSSYGQFSINAFRYMGFRIIEASDTLYGWLRMAKTNDFNPDSLSYRVDQLAYEGELTDILPVNQLTNLKIYPTITNDVVFIENNQATKTRLSIYSLSGKLLLQQELALHQNEVHLAAFPEGMYLIRISSADGEKTFKVMKQ
ncbi:MAG TPA: T9SS type A sorting domain-containing protein [Chitinophagales bacterium]|nr:T9SS type A sorting domain-containing protein [Chitinophagales bacterium]